MKRAQPPRGKPVKYASSRPARAAGIERYENTRMYAVSHIRLQRKRFSYGIIIGDGQ
jgi:hypothetical protein